MSRARNLLLLVLLVVCAVSFWLARRDDGGARTPATTVPAAAPVAAADDDGEPLPDTVHVAVLNGTGESGLARRISRRLPDCGCVVVATADAPHDTFSRSLLVNRRLTGAQANELAARLGGVPVVREWDPRCGEDAVLILGRDHERLRPSGTTEP